jgi:hypothetical protein
VRLLKSIFVLVGLLVLTNILFTAKTYAAGSGSVYLTPSSGTYTVGTTVTLSVRENSSTTAVNAAMAVITYNTSQLQFQSWDFGSSAFEIAAFSNGGGGTAEADRGTTNQSMSGDREIGKISFKVLTSGAATVNAGPSSVVVTTATNTDQVGTRTGATLTLQSGFENRVAHRPDGRSYYFTGSNRYYISNPSVRNCVIIRNNTGTDFLSSDGEIDAFTDAALAHCPYEKESGLNFVKESSSPTVWLVHADGTKQHAGSLCVVDPFTTVLKKFHVFIVPDGETGGHVQTSDWFASGSNCAVLPG